VLGLITNSGLYTSVLSCECFIHAGLLLFFGNAAFLGILRFLPMKTKEQFYLFIFCQIVFDFIVISVMFYSIPEMHTLFVLTFTFHIILTCIFLTRSMSLIVTVTAAVLAATPGFFVFFDLFSTARVFEEMKVYYSDMSRMVHFINNAGVVAGFFSIRYLTLKIVHSLINRERTLIKFNTTLKEVNEQKNLFTVRATHELKAPFAAIKSYLLIIRDGILGDVPEKAMEVVQKIIARCDWIDENITDIIRLSNLKTSYYQKSLFKSLDINAVITEVAEEAKKYGDQRNIQIQFTAAKRNVTVNGIAKELKILFTNLIINAVNYSESDQRVTVSLKKSKRNVTVSVADKGIGISKDDIKKIFNEYYRTERASTHNVSGNGLGLSIVKEIVRMHNGTIVVDSEPGKGSAFTVTFPS
jgi:signal transduction histidine kinase